MKTMNIDFEEKFNSLQNEFIGKQKKIFVNSSLKVYYGITTENNLRISFMSTVEPLKINSTKELKVSQGQESEDVYWTCFDLLNPLGNKVFYAFCEDLVESVTELFDESEAILSLKNRFHSWKSMFKNRTKMTPEVNQGLFGELYFMEKFLFLKYEQDVVIDSWSGPDGFSKDFAIDNTWYEVKTINSNSNTIKISSLGQLESTTAGTLVVIKIDKMSETYNDGYSNIYDLFKKIIMEIKSNESKEKFIEKLSKYGFDINENSNTEKYKFVDKSLYNVDKDFPRLKSSDIQYQEIANVKYELILSTLEKFKKEL